MPSLIAQASPSSWAGAKFSSTQFLDLGFPSMPIMVTSKPTKRARITCSLHTTPIFTFPKQPLQTPQSPTKDLPPPPPAAPPHWNLLERAAAKTLDAIESSLLSRERTHNLPRTADPRVQLAGNFAPVPENPATHGLAVAGKIPGCINGVYLRNGANPLHVPLAGHHLFDGDGMIHAVTFTGNSVSYACRFTKTHRLIQEREAGRPVFPKPIGELHGHLGIARLMLFYARGLFGLLDHARGTGVANAGLIYFNRRILAMSEDDLPYHVRITRAADVETVGRYDFEAQLRTTAAMIAHPKIDPISGELFALSYSVVSKPYLKFFKFSPVGKKLSEIDIPLDSAVMIHDFAITENFVVIPDHQVVFEIWEMIKGGSPVIYDKNKTSKFGILSKNAKNAENIVWVRCPDTFCFHLWNAWEEPENDEVVVIGSCMTPPDAIFNESDGNPTSILSEIRLNLSTGEAQKRPVIKSSDQINLEAGMVDRRLLGRRTRYAYLAIAEPWPKVSGFAKVEIATGKVEKYFYGDGRYGGEPCFVPREEYSGADEDDGYILAFVHDEKRCRSELVIVNAVTLEMEACVELPTRVPYGFHGTFISSKDLENQV